MLSITLAVALKLSYSKPAHRCCTFFAPCSSLVHYWQDPFPQIMISWHWVWAKYSFIQTEAWSISLENPLLVGTHCKDVLHWWLQPRWRLTKTWDLQQDLHGLLLLVSQFYPECSLSVGVAILSNACFQPLAEAFDAFTASWYLLHPALAKPCCGCSTQLADFRLSNSSHWPLQAATG